MYIEKLKLYNFRNLKDGEYSFSPGANFIVGQNGQGKTNLIEAISLLSAAKSFRTSTSSELVKWNTESGSVFAEVKTKLSDIELGIAIEHSKRKAFIDGKKSDTVAALIGKILCTSFAPNDLEIVKGTPQIRRQFIDRLLVDLKPHLVGDLVDYSKALRSKNALLKIGQFDASAAKTWNELLSKLAAKIVYERQVLITELQPVVNEHYRELAPLDGAIELRWDYRGLEDDFSERGYLEKYNQMYKREVDRGVTLIGPHRDDLFIIMGDKDSRAFASQGQSRSIVLALKLASIRLINLRRDEEPIVLLDDVDSELDQKRSEALFGLIGAEKRQFFITGTDRAAVQWNKVTGQRFRIENGSILIE